MLPSFSFLPHTLPYLVALLTLSTSYLSHAVSVKLDRHDIGTDDSPLVKRLLSEYPYNRFTHQRRDSRFKSPDGQAGIVRYTYGRESDQGETVSSPDRRRGVEPYHSEGQAARHEKRSSVGMNIDRSGGIAYTIDIGVGKDKKPVPVLVDTGSADIWVASSKCSNCTAAGMTDSGVSYDEGCEIESKSYGSGEVYGCLVNTDVTIGEFSMDDYPLLAAKDSQGFDGRYMSGILGLAGSRMTLNGHPTPMDRLRESKAISSPEIGFYLARSGDGSELIFDEAHWSQHANQGKKVTLQRTDDGGLYRVKLDAFIANGEEIADHDGGVQMQGIDVIIDTGTSDLRIPESMMLPIYASMGGNQFYKDTENEDKLVVPCEGFGNPDETFGFKFGGMTFYVKWSDFIGKPTATDQSFCSFRIMPTPIEDYIIIGSNFLRNIYHVVNVDSGEVTMYGLQEG
ncbi:hypothetical protein I317_03986 [Kwoniella heveanensis CBS 569]|nr:hypothetical protein I317_03986 [Kwoniella heveanensis CBS 569]